MKACSSKQYLFIIFADAAFHHFVNDFLRLAFVQRLALKNFVFFVHLFLRNFFTANIFRVCCCDLHSDIRDEFAELICFRYEVCFAVDFDKNTDTAASVDVGFNKTFSSDTACFVSCCGKTFLAKNLHCFGRYRRLLLPSAFLQSSIPAPVLSRSSFTALQLTAIVS